MTTNSDKRYINFPLFMLANTPANPQRGIQRIANYVLWKYARSCRRDPEAALIQLAYTVSRGDRTSLPMDVKDLLVRDDVVEFSEASSDAFIEPDGFEVGMKEMLEADPIELDEYEQTALVDWLALRDAGSFFDRRINDYDSIALEGNCTQRELEAYAARTGPLAYASVPASYFFEVYDSTKDIETMRLFRCVAAVRSLVGKKRFAGTVKDMLRARMMGAKSTGCLSSLDENCEALHAEYEELKSRYRFDRILREGAVRGFYVKLGLGRRVYLSLKAKDPNDLAAMLNRKSALHDAYKKIERGARSVA
ncbi:MAG: hypothetical protein KJ626_02300 [Verrucomicrobia bacterium]|nr:hypothetical protein [Verrucomicrobiota bacterium]